MRDTGINTVRLYSPPPDRVADAAADAQLFLIPDICWGPRRCELDDPERVRFIFDWTRRHSRRLAGHPAILTHSIGNEIPPLVVRWYGRNYVERFLLRLCETVKEASPGSLVTYANHPPTEHLNLPFLDVISYNVYLEREPEFRAYLRRLQNQAGERPLLLSEMGLDSRCHGEQLQARFLDWQLRAVFEEGLCGAAVYAWTDEWAIFDTEIEGWEFGLLNGRREPKPALETVRRIYTSSLYDLRDTPWPKVSVVVASYNGAATLDECLTAVGNLNYPNYEAIVIDDGSRDETPEIVARHPVKCVRVPNGGLSRARNLGIEESSGDYIAFTDSDAHPDPDWLYYLVTAMEQRGAAAGGGPNLCPRDDGFTAQCVDFAPGNPTHVLLDDTTAEHVPGCNMAFRKEALDDIGRFDPTHRAAGDDVDVCWKLLARARTIAFSPAAVVWHHRRPSIRAFLRQQEGYGYAEAHLNRRYPGRFNSFGYPVWTGSIYDGVHAGWKSQELPGMFRSRVYQGHFGGAQFQSLYQPFPTWWFQVFSTIEWMLLVLCVLLSAGLAMPGAPGIGIALMALGALLAAATATAAILPGIYAVRSRRWRGGDRFRGCLLIAWLHLLQPLARARGRFRGWLFLRRKRVPGIPPSQRVWGNLSQRESWLERLQGQMHSCGWICRPSSDWDDGDLDILGPGPCRLKLTSVYEDDVERGYHFVRYRITAQMKPAYLGAAAILALAIAGTTLTPPLMPLALPLLGVLGNVLTAKTRMVAAISQLALESAEALGMPGAEGY